MKRGVGMAIGNILSGAGTQRRRDQSRRATAAIPSRVAVTDIGSGARPRWRWSPRRRWTCRSRRSTWSAATPTRAPIAVGESGSRNTAQTGQAVIEAAENLKQQIAAKGLPTACIASRSPRPHPTRQLQGVVRSTFGAHFVEVEVDTELGRVRRSAISRARITAASSTRSPPPAR